jgi:hypothetical protein
MSRAQKSSGTEAKKKVDDASEIADRQLMIDIHLFSDVVVRYAEDFFFAGEGKEFKMRLKWLNNCLDVHNRNLKEFNKLVKRWDREKSARDGTK